MLVTRTDVEIDVEIVNLSVMPAALELVRIVKIMTACLLEEMIFTSPSLSHWQESAALA